MSRGSQPLPTRKTPSDAAGEKAESRGAAVRKLAVLVVALVAAITLFFVFRDRLTFENLARHEATLRAWRAEHPVPTYLAAFAIYVAVTGLSIPGAAVLTLAYGWIFGFWRGTLLVSFASTAGATVAFLLARYLFHDAVQRRFGRRLAPINRAIEQEGAVYLLTLRLMPQVPFVVLNVLLALTPIRVTTYWWASQLGMLPATCVYLYAGAQVPSLDVLAERGLTGLVRPELMAGLVLLAILPLATRWLVKRFRQDREK